MQQPEKRMRCVLLSCLALTVVLALDKTKPSRKFFSKTAHALQATGSETGYHDENLAYLQDIARNGLDPLKALDTVMKGDAFNAVLANTDIQRKIIEHMPQLQAFDGFKNLGGKVLDAENTKKEFAKGIDSMMKFMKDSITKLKDPAEVFSTLAKMAASGDQVVQDLMKRAQAGEKEAIEQLQEKFSQEAFPGVDFSVMKNLVQNHTFDRFMNMTEVMHFLNQDPSMAEVFDNYKTRRTQAPP